MKATLMRTFVSWLPLAVVISGVFGFSYIALQQSYRLGLNDPQIQMAEDAASALNNNTPLDSVVPSEQIDISKSLKPWIAVFNPQGQQIASSGFITESVPLTMPHGLFIMSKDYNYNLVEYGEDRITWQPKGGVRQAIVIVPTTSGFVVAGRNMKEIEGRESNLLMTMLIGWLLVTVATFCIKYVVVRYE